jgi:hypothetical protein
MNVSCAHDISMSAIVTELRLVSIRSDQLDKELFVLADQSNKLANSFQHLDNIPTVLASISAECNSLASVLYTSNNTANMLSSAVRELDSTQSKLSLALARVELVINIKNSIAQVQKYLANNQLYEAAVALHKVLYHNHIPRDLTYHKLIELESELRLLIESNINLAVEKLDYSAALKLCRLLTFVGQGYQGLISYCEVQKKIIGSDLSNNALTLQSQPLSSVIDFIQLITKQLDLYVEKIKFSVKAVQLCFGVGSHVRMVQSIDSLAQQQLQPLVSKFLADKKIIKLAKEIKQIQMKQQQARKTQGSASSSSSSSSSSSKLSNDIDLKSLDTLLEEISFICRECELFHYNTRQLAEQAVASMKNQIEAEKNKKLAEGHLSNTIQYNLSALHSSLSSDDLGIEMLAVNPLIESIQELLGHYISLEEYYMIANVAKAIELDHTNQLNNHNQNNNNNDELDELITQQATQSTSNSLQFNLNNSLPTGIGIINSTAGVSTVFLYEFHNSLSTSLVDDVFYILKKCCERAFNTYSASSACAIVNHINNILARDYREIYDSFATFYANRYIKSLTTNSTVNNIATLLNSINSNNTLVQSYQQRKLADDRQLILISNNIELSINNIATLKAHLEEEFDAVFNNQSNNTNQPTSIMIKHCLADLSETRKLFCSSQSKLIQLIVQSELISIKPPLDNYSNVDYELKELNYSERELQDPYILALIGVIQRDILPLSECLTLNNFILLLQNLIDWLVGRIENISFKKKFSFWGGLQFDRDIRKLAKFFTATVEQSKNNSSSLFLVNVSDRFLRLIQFGSILQLEKLEEMIDYWENNNNLLKFSAAEVKKILNSRTEFSAKDIANLKLQ